VLRRVWAPRGQRPIATVHPRYAWLYVYGFVRPTSGAVEWFLGNAANTALVAAVLARFAAATGAGAGKTVVLVLDPAGWHVSEQLAVPEGLRRVFLPPYSPELRPAERLWPLAREAVANTSFATLADLDRVVAARCLDPADQPDLIRAHTRFPWWPEAA
jgi:DDE superfamily endonuclease